MSLTTLVVDPGAFRVVCFPNIQAAHLGEYFNLLAAVCSCRLAAVLLRTPVRKRCLILLKSRCPSRWCHLSSSFCASERLVLAESTAEMTLYRDAVATS